MIQCRKRLPYIPAVNEKETRLKYRTEYDKELIGRNLRRCREAKNLTVEEVRRYLRLGSQQAVYKWEEGKCYPQTDTMFALMELYEIGLQDIIYEKQEDLASSFIFYINKRIYG